MKYQLYMYMYKQKIGEAYDCIKFKKKKHRRSVMVGAFVGLCFCEWVQEQLGKLLPLTFKHVLLHLSIVALLVHCIELVVFL